MLGVLGVPFASQNVPQVVQNFPWGLRGARAGAPRIPTGPQTPLQSTPGTPKASKWSQNGTTITQHQCKITQTSTKHFKQVNDWRHCRRPSTKNTPSWIHPHVRGATCKIPWKFESDAATRLGFWAQNATSRTLCLSEKFGRYFSKLYRTSFVFEKFEAAWQFILFSASVSISKIINWLSIYVLKMKVLCPENGGAVSLQLFDKLGCAL